MLHFTPFGTKDTSAVIYLPIELRVVRAPIPRVNHSCYVLIMTALSLMGRPLHTYMQT